MTYQELVNFKGRDIPNVDRNTLAQWFADFGFRVGAEVGVEQGVYSEILCKANPDLKLYSIDAWEAFKGYREHVSQEKLDGFMAATVQRLSPYGVEIIKGYSVPTAKLFVDESLDFVYLDADHTYDAVYADIEAWLPKVRPGGIIAGHDFVRRSNMPQQKVIEAVEDYTKEHGITKWHVLGRKETINGELRDKSRSWLWIKR